MKKTALITGAAKGLGAQLSRSLAQEGYSVILHYHTSKSEVEKLADEIGAQQIVQADLTNLSQVKQMFETIDPIDVLINNVGDFIYQPLLETKEEDFDYCIQNNLNSAWYCMKQALDKMKEKKWGRIINFGCTNCDQLSIRPCTTPYYIAKSGLLMVSRELARELTNTGVTINMVSPGVLPTGHSADNPDVVTVPFDAIVRAVLFLISDNSSHINGANLEVSGGWRPQ